MRKFLLALLMVYCTSAVAGPPAPGSNPPPILLSRLKPLMWHGTFYEVPEPTPDYTNSKGIRVTNAGAAYIVSLAGAAPPTLQSSALGILLDASGAIVVSPSSGIGTVTSSGSPVSSNIAKFTTATNIAPAAYSDIVNLWTTCSGFLKSDGTCSSAGTVTSSGYTSGTPLASFSTATNITPATYSNVVALFSTCSGTQYLGADGSCHTASASSAWSSLTAPTGNLALNHAAYTTTFTWGGTTGSGVNLFNLTDTASNTGTGYMLNVNLASGSAAKPAFFGVNGVGVGVNNGGVLGAVGGGHVNADQCNGGTCGTVTSVGSGTGLTGGPITGSGTLSYDYTHPVGVSYTVGATSVVAHHLVKLANDGTVVPVTGTEMPLGIAETSVSTGSSVLVDNFGPSTCVAEGAITAGDYMIAGTTDPSACADSGYAALNSISFSTRVVGKATSAGTDGNPFSINAWPRSGTNGSGTGTVTVVSSGSLTSTALVTGGGTTMIQTPSATSTLDTSGNLSTPGSVTAGAGSGATSAINLATPGTAPAAPSTGVNIIAPASVSTPYNLAAPTALPANGHFLSCTTSGSTCTITDGGTGTTATVPIFQSETANTTQAVGTALTQNHVKILAFHIDLPTPANTIGWSITTADNSSNVYDIGYYGPGCIASATNIPLAASTGSIAGTSAAPSTGLHTASVLTPTTLQPGWYGFAYTSSAASPTAVFGGSNSTSVFVLPYALTDLGAIGGATLPSTVTCPALVMAFNTAIFTVSF